MEDLKKIALENIRNFIKVTPKSEILSRLEILSSGHTDGYLIMLTIKIDNLSPSEIEDIEYLEDRILTHLEVLES